MKKLYIVLFFLLVSLSYAQIDPLVVDNIVRYSLPIEGPGGSLIIAKDGNVIYSKAFGYADLENKVLNTTGTVFQVGSITKQFTAAGIMKLVEDGKLSLSDTLTKFIPDYPAPGNKVTIENLLLHNSGIPNFTSLPEWNPAWESKRSIEDVIEMVKNKPFDYQPGERFQYNNSGYAILSFIIEKISGLSYADYMKKTFFKPAGMTQTCDGILSDNVGIRSKGYTFDQEKSTIKPAVFTEFPQLAGAGSILSTPTDLILWDEVIKHNKILKADSWKRIQESHVTTNFGDSVYYGYGWVNMKFGNRHVIWHNGGMAGFLSAFYRFPDDGYTFVWLSNLDFVVADGMVRQIANYIFKTNLDKRASINLSKEQLKNFEAQYVIGGSKYTFSVVKDTLKLINDNQLFLPLSLIPTTEDSFFCVERYNFYVKMKKNGEGIFSEGVVYDAGITAKFYRAGYEPKYDVKNLTEDELKKYVGEYYFAPTVFVNIFIKEGKLKAFITGQPEYELQYIGEDKFQLAGLTGFTFIFKSENGVINTLVSSQPNGEFSAKKK